MFKSNKGFTLVELIVVIAILAILAGVAIPVYNGYIKRANDAAVVTELDAIQTAAQAANATVGGIDLIIVTPTNIQISGPNNAEGKSVLSKGFNADFGLFYPDAANKGSALGVFGVAVELKGSYEEGAYWANGEWNKGAYTGNFDGNIEATGSVVTPGGNNGGNNGGNGGNNGGNGGENTGTEGTNCECTTAADANPKDGKCDICGKDLPEDWEGEPV